MNIKSLNLISDFSTSCKVKIKGDKDFPQFKKKKIN